MRRNKYTYLWVVQGNYGQGWEDLTAAVAERKKEAVADLYAYRQNEPNTPTRLIQRRELN